MSMLLLELNKNQILTADSDMSNIEVPWQIDGVMTPEQSVTAMLPVIESRRIQHSGTFWTWEGRVSHSRLP